MSDIIATLILDDIKACAKRINNELGITPEYYPNKLFNEEFLVNPYKHDDVLLVPIDILHEIPAAKFWEDIDYVAAQNNIIRAEMNFEVASEWHKYSAYERKAYLKRTIFEDSEVCNRVIENIKLKSSGLMIRGPTSDFFLRNYRNRWTGLSSHERQR